ncbi:MAG: hypothetical protein KDK99_09910 [Verrucomicrobiales bacterium]|nr:hypothetical protein [Verrucomicrobiales bacterium]
MKPFSPKSFLPSLRGGSIKKWTRLSGQVAGLQVLIQGVNAVTGLIFVRYMAKDDYAWFTLAASLLATLNLLGDGGVSTGLTAIGGRVHDQPGPFARLLQQGLRLSLRLTVIGFVLAVPLFYGLYVRIGASTGLTLAALVLAGLAAWPSVATVMLNVANRLHTRVGVIQLGDVMSALVRLVITSVLWLGGWLAVLPALLATVLAGWAQALLIRVRSRHFLESPATDVSYQPELHGFVRSLYGNHVFFCLQAQVATWIIGWLAGSAEVADLGALARLGVLFSIISAPFYYVAVPALARIHSIAVLRRKFLLTFAAGGAVVLLITGSSWVFPRPLLWLLGGNYSHLTIELPVALAAQGLTFLNTLSWNLLLMRQWVKKPWIVIPLTFVGYVFGAVFLDLSRVDGVLWFSVASIIPSFGYGTIAVATKLKWSVDAQDRF